MSTKETKDMFFRRIWNAEGTVWGHPPDANTNWWSAPTEDTLTSAGALRVLKRNVFASSWWKQRSKLTNVDEVVLGHWWCNRHNHGVRASRQTSPRWIGGSALYVHHMSRHGLFHALAHTLTPEETHWHGPEFAQQYLALVGRFMGAEVKAALRQAFRDEKVKTRVVSEASRQAASERMKARHFDRARDATLEMLKELAQD